MKKEEKLFVFSWINVPFCTILMLQCLLYKIKIYWVKMNQEIDFHWLSRLNLICHSLTLTIYLMRLFKKGAYIKA